MRKFKPGDKVRINDRGLNELGSASPWNQTTIYTVIDYYGDRVRTNIVGLNYAWFEYAFELAEPRYKRNLPDWF
jgi:hypothetical protein